jgi:hypothetical protein
VGITPWQCAQGDAPPITLPVAATVALAPPDDSVDTNNIVINGNGTITSFGPPPGPQLIDPSVEPPEIVLIGVTKRVTFTPSGGNIVLSNGAALALLGAANRTITHKSVGVYQCDTLGNWVEVSFWDTTQVPGSGGGGAGTPGPGYAATSTTSLAVASGSKTFATQSGLAYSVGARARASSAGTSNTWMEGQVTAYAGASLTINVDTVNGSGTHADWNINLAGIPGQQGPPGAAGTPGAPGTPGTPGAAGPGVPTGGTATQILQKNSTTDYDTSWVNKPVSFPEAPTDGANYARNNSAWNNVDTLLALKAPLASPVFTGDPQAPTPATADNDTSVATTAFVKAQAYAPLASPTFTGDPKAPTPATSDNDTSIATTAFVQSVLAASGYIPDAPNDANYYGRHAAAWSALDTIFAKLASPTFTGDPKAPTPTAGDNDTSIATTAFVSTAITNAAVPAPSSTTPAMDGTGAAGSATAYARGDHVHPTDTSRAPLASPTFTGTPAAPTVTPATDNSTKLATTAFVQSAVSAAGGITAQAPTTQRITATGAFTYTPTSAAVKWIRVKMAASGGGGSSTSGAAAGGNAGDLTLSLASVLAITLQGGRGASSIGGGSGGVVTIGTLPTGWAILFQASGGSGSNGATYGAFGMGGAGGNNMFGGGGGGGGQSVGVVGVAGTGAGGGGGGWGGNSVAAQGAGGGAGACMELIIPIGGGTITGNLGNFGAGTAAGGQYNGAAGGLGSVNIEEHYNW